MDEPSDAREDDHIHQPVDDLGGHVTRSVNRAEPGTNPHGTPDAPGRSRRWDRLAGPRDSADPKADAIERHPTARDPERDAAGSRNGDLAPKLFTAVHPDVEREPPPSAAPRHAHAVGTEFGQLGQRDRIACGPAGPPP